MNRCCEVFTEDKGTSVTGQEALNKEAVAAMRWLYCRANEYRQNFKKGIERNEACSTTCVQERKGPTCAECRSKEGEVELPFLQVPGKRVSCYPSQIKTTMAENVAAVWYNLGIYSTRRSAAGIVRVRYGQKCP